MNAKTTIRKVLFIALWLCIGGGMFTLLLAAISKKNKGLCKDYHITIKGAYNNFFIDQKDVEQLLMNSTRGPIRGRSVISFNLHQLEQMLERNTWIDDAELYFDNQDILHITVVEKEPVARIFTSLGNSFYIDSLGKKMPLSEKLSARVPVFTNFPDKKSMNGKDSVLLDDVRKAANFILNDPFWMSQVAQIDITPEKKFEMIPVVGNHLVKLGDGENIGQKFRRLMIFYKQVLSKTGFDKYKVIDVRYQGQVVVSRFAGDPKVDSVQLRKNVEKLLKQSRDAQNDTVMKAMTVTGKYQIENDQEAVIAEDQAGPPKADPAKPSNPNLMKPSLNKPDTKKEDKPKNVPKAVMPKKPAEEENGGYN